MATLEQRQKFIAEITPLVQKYAAKYGYSQNVVPAIVAQSCCESGFGNLKNSLPRIANNYFGIRHGSKSNFMGLAYDSRTGKIVPSEQITITVSNRGYYWRAYNSMEESVEGYFKFLTEHKPYKKLKDIDDPYEYLMAVGRAGYASSGTKYSTKCIEIINENNLIEYNEQNKYDSSNITNNETPIQEESTTISEENSNTTEETEENNQTGEDIKQSSTKITVDDSIASSDKKVIDSGIANIKESNTYSTQYFINNNSTVNETTTGIPNNLNLAQNSYLEISDCLTDLISNELSVIESIANTYNDMDKDLADEQINNFLTPTISIDTDFTSYMFEPTSLIQGTTGRINKSDISNLISGSNLTGALHENFTNAKESAKYTMESIETLQDIIKNYNNNSVWIKVSQKLTTYNELLKLKIDSANELENAMAEALKYILSYMEDEDYIDDTKLLETVETILETKTMIDALKLSINETQTATKEITDDKGNIKIITFTEYVYSVSARESMQNKVTELEQIVEDLTKKVKKQEGLYDAMAQAEQIVNNALSNIYNNYATKVNSIIPSTAVSYIPPTNTQYNSPLSIPSKLTQVSDQNKIPNGKVSKNDFDNDNTLINTYGTYEDYLNGVEKENNPKYTQTANNGIELSKELSDLLIKTPTSKKENSYSKVVVLSNTSNNQEQENNQAPPDSTNTVSNTTSSSSNNFYESSEISSSLDNENTSENNQETSTIDTTPSQDNNNTIKDSTNSTIINPDKNEEKEPTSSKDTYYYDNDKKDIFSNNSTSIFKTVGIASATIGAIGATAYGAKKYLEKRKNENDNDDSPSSTIDNRSEGDNDDTGLDGFE